MLSVYCRTTVLRWGTQYGGNNNLLHVHMQTVKVLHCDLTHISIVIVCINGELANRVGLSLSRHLPRDEDIQEEAVETGIFRADSQDVSRRNSVPVERLRRGT